MYLDWCGKSCSSCKTSCLADESMPCSPDCEGLDEGGQVIDYLKCLESGCDVIQIEEVSLDKKEIARWQRLIDMNEVDFSKEGIDKNKTLEIWSVEFEDGHVADLRVCSGNNNLFLDAILFAPMNSTLSEVSVPDCPNNILGDHLFNPEGGKLIYVMRISEKTE